MRNIKRFFLAMLPMLLSCAIAFAQLSFDEVQRKIQDKVNVDQLQLHAEGDTVVLEGRTKLLKDKIEAEEIARKETKKEVVNNMIVSSPEKRDDEITVDVIAQIKRDSPQNFVFDSLSAETKNGNVILTGQVRNAYLFDIAEKAAAKISGVKAVTNNIEVLPPSQSDDRLRAAIYRRLRNDDRLFYYFLGAQPSINLIVNGSRVTLAGYVDTESDRVLAGSLVRQIPGVLSVENQLKVD